MIKDKLKELEAVRAEISEYFGGINIYDTIIDQTNVYWTSFGEYSQESHNLIRGSHVGYSDMNPLDTESDCAEHDYSEQVKHIVRKEGFTLICIRTCTGDGDENHIFDNKLEIKESDLDDFYVNKFALN